MRYTVVCTHTVYVYFLGTLHEEVFFSYDACAPSLRNPRPGDQVWFSAVECEPCRYNEGSRWRAIRVTGRAANHAARQAAAAAEVFAVEQSEALRWGGVGPPQ